MKSLDLIPICELRGLVSYDAETGALTWLARNPDDFQGDYRRRAGLCARWNADNAGKEIRRPHCMGYIRVGLGEKDVLAHRVAWALHFGKWPVGQIDHINGNKKDNRLANLRQVSALENSKNQPRKRNNTSGVVGVRRHRNSWRAEIGEAGRMVFVAQSFCFGRAVAARKAAEKAAGFHENHGRSL